MNKSKKVKNKKIYIDAQTKKNLKNATNLKAFIDNKLSFNRTNLASDKNLHKFFKDILIFIKKIYKIDNKKYKVFEKLFDNWCDSIIYILKQHDEFYMTNIINFTFYFFFKLVRKIRNICLKIFYQSLDTYYLIIRYMRFIITKSKIIFLKKKKNCCNW